MPARKNPVKNLEPYKIVNSPPDNINPRFESAAANALTKKTSDGLNLSANAKTANSNVPTMNPSCTADVKCPNVKAGKSNSLINESITPFPANQRDTQANCAMTIIGNTFNFGFLILEF